MTSLRQLAFKNLSFYRRSARLTVLGAAIGGAVLIGALSVADSLQYSLQRIALARLGQANHILNSGDRMVRTALADSLAEALQRPAAPVLALAGVAGPADGRQQVQRVQVYGVEARFFQFAPRPFAADSLAPRQVYINSYLARRLHLQPGDAGIVRIAKPAMLPLEMPLARESEQSLAIRFQVKGILADGQYGRFSLQAGQREPYNIFFSLTDLQRETGHAQLCNMILLDTPASSATIHSLLKKYWQPEDMGLFWRESADERQRDLASRRIFFEPPIIDAAAAPVPVFTYLINRIQAGPHITPYSFVSTANVLPLNRTLDEHDIIVNQWLADDLQVHEGDRVTLHYFVLSEHSQLQEQSAVFNIVHIIPLKKDLSLMPSLPGLSDVDNCRDWHPGIPIDLKQIRDKDEAYWETSRGTPKAFISPVTAARLWSNRFGRFTALRFPEAVATGTIEARLLAALDPSQFGLTFEPVREQALQAAVPMTDFSQLFIGLSFFVIVAASLLAVLLFQLYLEERRPEIGLYLALGFTVAQIRRLFLIEGLVLAVLAMLLAPLFGWLYHGLLLLGIQTWWSGAFAMSRIAMTSRPITMLFGTLIATALLMILFIRRVHRFAAHMPHDLQRAMAKEPRQNVWLWTSVLLLTSGLLLLLFASLQSAGALAAFFFAAGFLWISGLISLSKYFLVRYSGSGTGHGFTLPRLAVRNAARHQSRSMAIISLLALGVFLVTAIGLNRVSPPAAQERRSGTGGFTFWFETLTPMAEDPDTPAGRQTYDLTDSLWQQVRFFSMRRMSGDDASCLNLSRSRQAPLLGIKSANMAARRAFSFVQKVKEVDDPWQALEVMDAEVVPGIVDHTVLQWGLGRSLGDTLIYKNQAGHPVKIRIIAGLANSVFQGYVLISESALLQQFPAQTGFNLFLVDAAGADAREVINGLQERWQDQGAEIQRTTDRLAMFNEITNTYLSMFLMLGGLALLIGSVGVGVVVARNMYERRAELAVMAAIGFTLDEIRQTLQTEYRWLLLAGLLIGSVAAFIAVLPAVWQQGMNTLVTLILLGMVWGSGVYGIRRAVMNNAGKEWLEVLRKDR